MALPKCRSCGYELTGTSTAIDGGLVYDWGHEADCLARKLAATESKLEALSGKLRPLTCVKHTWSSEEECPYCFNAELKSRLDSATRIVRNLVDWSTPKRLKGFTILTAIVKDAEQFLGVAPAWQAEESRIALEHGETEDSVVETPCCRGLAPASECKCERERVVEKLNPSTGEKNGN